MTMLASVVSVVVTMFTDAMVHCQMKNYWAMCLCVPKPNINIEFNYLKSRSVKLGLCPSQ